jgi:hypothetical protein
MNLDISELRLRKLKKVLSLTKLSETKMRKAIHLPSNSKTIIINQYGDYFEILLNGDYKTVPKEEIACIMKMKLNFLHSKV